MAGKTVVITGASGGIGLETTRQLAAKGARIIMVVRNRDKTEAAIRDVHDTVPNGQLEMVIADLYSQAETRRAAAEVAERAPHIDVLINNAGLIHDKRELTVDGIERTFALNHLAPFLFTYQLRERLGDGSRIITVSSEGHKYNKLDWSDIATCDHWPGAIRVYGTSKLCNIWFARESARRLAAAKVTSNALHPGAVASSFGQSGSRLMRASMKLVKPFLLSVEKGAATSVYLASSPEVATVTGEYFAKCRVAKPSALARDDDSAKRLWALSEKLCGVTWS